MSMRTMHICPLLSALSARLDNLDLSARVRLCPNSTKPLKISAKVRNFILSVSIRVYQSRRCWGGHWVECPPLKGVHPGHRHTSNQYLLSGRIG